MLELRSLTILMTLGVSVHAQVLGGGLFGGGGSTTSSTASTSTSTSKYTSASSSSSKSTAVASSSTGGGGGGIGLFGIGGSNAAASSSTTTSPSAASSAASSSVASSSSAAASSTAAVPTTSKSTSSVASTSATASSTAAKSSSIATTSSSPSTTLSTSSAVASSQGSSTATTASNVLPAPSPSKTSVPSGYIRGVNLGGWLILEPWMDQVLLNGSNAPDEATYDQSSNAAQNLQNHWSSYFTSSDVASVAAFGMNALRIPIGYWAFQSYNANTTYLQGAEYWLDQAIGWARQNGMKVMVDVHGSPGSQNGWDHSGNAMAGVNWQAGSNTSYLGANMQQNINVLQYVATKYGSLAMSDVVYAIEISNEPICWGANDFSVTKNWAATAYNAVIANVKNTNLQVIMHDSFMGPQNWYDLASSINGALAPSPPQFALDLHLYQNMVSDDNTLNVSGHIAKACNWGNCAVSPVLPLYIGEFSAATNVCVNPNGTSFGVGADGSQTCDPNVPGCQCTNTVSIDRWSDAMKQTTRMYWEAQLQAFEHFTAGYFLWSLHGFGAWSLADLINYNIIGPTIDDRNYGSQCTFVSSS